MANNLAIGDPRDTINNWKKFLVKEQLYDDHWLLAYEVLMKEWIPTSKNYLDDDPFFNLTLPV